MHPSNIIRLALTLAVATFGLAAFGTSSATASSIVYIKGGDVWVSSPDGVTSRKLTSGGNWHSPTQADDGTVAAVQGADSPITIMDGYGRVIRKVTTPSGAETSNGGTFAARPVNLDFSPSGTKIGYEYVTQSCPPASSCGARNSTFYTWANRETPVSEFGNQFNVGDPSMINEDRALAFGGAGRQVNIDILGGGDFSTTHWWDDSDIFNDSTDLSDGELTRQRHRVAVIRGYNDTTSILVSKVNGDPASSIPAPPDPACIISGTPTYDDPTWSPDGTQLAFAISDGVYLATLPTVEEGTCSGASLSETPILPGASQPDWGPANVLTGNPPAGGCDKAKAAVAKAKKRLADAKDSGKAGKIAKAKAKLKKAKQAQKEACA